MKRTLGATILAALVIVLTFSSAQSDPSGGVQVVPLADHNALEKRVTAAEARLDALEVTPSPSPTPTPTPTPEPTPTPTPTPSPTPSPTPTPSGEYPNAANTGVPDGTQLTAYTGPMTISTPTVIDSKTITGTLTVTGGSLTVRNSVVNGRIFSQRDNGATMLIEDTTINVPNANVAGLERHHYVARRVEVKGGIRSMECTSNCEVYDSWLHGQWMPNSGDPHGDGFLSNGGSNMVIQHNTLACDSAPNGNGGACSAAVALYGDNEAVRNVVVKDNLFKAAPSSYCMYAGSVSGKPYGGFNVDVTGNVFERFTSSQKTPKECAYFGSVAAMPRDAESAWSGNTYTDGNNVTRP